MDIADMDLGLPEGVAHPDFGGWISQIPGLADVRLWVRGMSGEVFAEIYRDLARRAPDDLRDERKKLTPEGEDAVLCRAAADALLKGWEGFDRDGRPLPYDHAMAREMLLDPDWRPLLEAVLWAAQAVDQVWTARQEERRQRVLHVEAMAW